MQIMPFAPHTLHFFACISQRKARVGILSMSAVQEHYVGHGRHKCQAQFVLQDWLTK